MGESSAIEWTDHTFNPWWGCTKVSPGCANCYAETLDHRFGGGHWGKGAPRRRTKPANWNQVRKWNREAQRTGVRKRVFCASMADVFDPEVPIEWLYDLLELIDHCRHLDWLLLTKRPELVKKRISQVADYMAENSIVRYDMVSLWICGAYPAHVWLGTSVEDQQRAGERIPALLDIPAAVRFLSCEPLLGQVVLNRWMHNTGYETQDEVYRCTDCGATGTGHFFTVPSGGDDFVEQCHSCGSGCELRSDLEQIGNIDWVIVGGESGPGARPMALGWAKDLVRQCQAARVPVFVKQLGDHPTNREGEPCPHITAKKGNDMTEWPEELRVRQLPESAVQP